MLASVFETNILNIRGIVAVLTILRYGGADRTKQPTLVELLQAVHEIRLDDNIRDAIITCARPKALAAGADIKELALMTPIGASTVLSVQPREVSGFP